MIAKEYCTDYVIYDQAKDRLLTFSNGDIIFYADKQEALDDVRGESEIVIKYKNYNQL